MADVKEGPFKEGDVVRMKGQVIPLTVKTARSEFIVDVQWFDREGHLHETELYARTLEKYTPQGG